jgi:phage shock protein C
LTIDARICASLIGFIADQPSSVLAAGIWGLAPWSPSAGRAQDEGMSELRRPRNGRVIGGVCAALARRFGWDVTLVRVLTVASLLLPGPQLIIYVIAWIVIPGEPDAVTVPSAATTTSGVSTG